MLLGELQPNHTDLHKMYGSLLIRVPLNLWLWPVCLKLLGITGCRDGGCTGLRRAEHCGDSWPVLRDPSSSVHRDARDSVVYLI